MRYLLAALCAFTLSSPAAAAQDCLSLSELRSKIQAAQERAARTGTPQSVYFAHGGFDANGESVVAGRAMCSQTAPTKNLLGEGGGDEQTLSQPVPTS